MLKPEGLAQCLIIYQIIIILMACSYVYKKKYTVNRLLNPNLDLDELFIETCARSAKTFLFFWRPFMYFLMSLSPCPGLVIFTMQYVYIKSPITAVYSSFWKLGFQSYLSYSQAFAVLAVLDFRLSIIHNIIILFIYI